LRQSLLHQRRKRDVEATFQCNPQQYKCHIGIQILLARLVILVRLPGLQKSDKVRQRIFSLVPWLVILHATRQAGRVARQLCERHVPDIGALRQFGDVVGNRIVKAQLTLLDRLLEQCGGKELPDRGEVEDRIRGDR
jgi:hypothetical protein